MLAPPYDVIPPAYQDELYARDPRNIVRVVLNRTPGDAGYAEAGATYARWLDEGLLTPDNAARALRARAGASTADGTGCAASACWRASAPRTPRAA